MNPLTLQDVLAHQATVPWPQLHQVEQDLLLCLAMQAIFDDEFLASQVAMRGGTVLHKVHLAPAARYSEDIDLVAVGERPEEHIKKALMRVLRPIFGKEQSSVWTTLQLAVRNVVKVRLSTPTGSSSKPGCCPLNSSRSFITSWGKMARAAPNEFPALSAMRATS